MNQSIFPHSNCCVKRGKNAKTTTIKKECVLSRKQQIPQNRAGHHVRQNQKIFAGVNSRRSEEV
jgi:hypothetical protein